MRLTNLTSVSVLALLALAPVQAFSAFEFVAPKTVATPSHTAPQAQHMPHGAITHGTITATQSHAPAVPAPVVDTGDLPMPTTKESAADLVKAATNPTMQQPAQFGSEAVPLTPVVRESDALVVDTRVPSNKIRADIQDLPPLPPMPKQMNAAPVAPVAPSRVVAPTAIKTASRAPATIPAPVMPSNPYDIDVPISSFGVVPDMPATIPVTAPGKSVDEEKIVQGFGRDVPLVLALQQIVPPSYRYSFDDGISPGMRISWSGDRPWKDIIMEIAQHNSMNVDIVSNVVAFHRGGTSSAPRSVVNDVREVTDYAPALPTPVQSTHVQSTHVAAMQPQKTQPARVINIQDEVAAVKPVAKKAAFDPLLQDDVPAKTKVENKKILTADASMAVQAVDDAASFTPESFSAPMPLAPMDDETTMRTNAHDGIDVPRSSSRNMMTAPQAEVASAPEYVEADMNSSREWQAFKGETLRQALTAWSNNVGVSLVWSSEYDYPLQTDVRIASDYKDAVRTLLAGFSKAQPRPLGRLFGNEKAGAQPVLIIETQRLTN